MPSKVAPPKCTGGGGTFFESKVCAWFLAHMLANEPPLGPGPGHLKRVDFQVRPEEWFLDDLILTLTSGAGQHRCALSVKSNTQFTRSEAPVDFVRIAWEQLLGGDSSPFNETSDFMGLVTTPLSIETLEALDFVVSTAKEGDPQLLPGRYAQKGWANKVKRSMFNSFLCPQDLPQANGVTSEDTGRLLACLCFFQFDFEAPVSEYEKQAIERCRRALRSGKVEDGARLWTHLWKVSANKGPKGGCINRLTLLDELRFHFELADLPDHRADWGRLRHLTSAAMGQVLDTIGGLVRLDRQQDLEKLKDKLCDAACVVLLGPSGAGKSAIAKHYAERLIDDGRKCLWFNARSFDRRDFAEFQSYLQLSHPLPELLNEAPDADAIVVLDGLDRHYDGNVFSLVAAFIDDLSMDRKSSPWRVVMTCQTQEWPRLRQSLLQAGLPAATWPAVECEQLSMDALKPVWQAIPHAARLQRNHKLLPLLSNLKILDLIASRLTAGGNVQTSSWVGESSIANWYWEDRVAVGKERRSRELLVMLIAERQADELRPAIPLSAFSASESLLFDGLEQDGICRRTDEGQIVFSHDLLGDWARLRILIARSGEIAEFLQKRLDSPLWHRAIRLYGMYLLEHTDDIAGWRALIVDRSLQDNEGARDLLLESIIFAADPWLLLTKVVSDLMRDECRLLRRLLGRFLAFATLPDQRYLAIARMEGQDDASVSALYRRPNRPYWPPVLRYLYEHRAKVLPAAPIEVARATELWLNCTPVGAPLRREAAELGLILGERARKARNKYGGFEYEHRKLFYRVALAGADELPDEVAEFALKACERSNEEGKSDESDTGPEVVPMSILSDPRYDPDERVPGPWPDGPRTRVDHDFQEIVFASGTILPLIRTRPAIAREVVLASLIKARRLFEWSNRWHEGRELDLDSGRHWHPPLYVHGPFLVFLQTNFSEGLETIARLIDFASDRWQFHTEMDAREHKSEMNSRSPDESTLGRMMSKWRKPPGTAIIQLEKEERELIGDTRVYGWSAGINNPPSEVQAALMALEQYFYSEIEEGRPVEEKVRAVLERARSTAFLKVLCDVGKRKTSLFEYPLRPLLAVPEIFEWDIKAYSKGRHHLMMFAAMQGPLFFRLAQAFHGLEHRSKDLRQIAFELFLSSKEMQEFLTLARKQWEQRLKSSPDDPFRDIIQQLIVSFDLDNYRLYEHPEHGRMIGNVRAQELDAERAGEKKAFEEQTFLALLPSRCRQMINEGTVLTGDKLEIFLNQVKSIVQRCKERAYGNPPAISSSEIDSWSRIEEADGPANALTGVAAVLIRLHGEWLAAHPEHKQWCLDRLRAAIFSPPPRDPMDAPESAVSWTWDCFAAEALPDLWVEDTENVELRHLVARLVFAPHYEAIKILFQRCGENRAVLGADFHRLRRLVFEFAHMHSRIIFVQQARQFLEPLPEDEVRRFYEVLEAWAEERVTAFVEKTLPPPTNDWDDMDQPELFLTIDGPRKQVFGRCLLDFGLVRAAQEWLPPLDQALNERERRDWLGFWRAALMFTLNRIPEDTDRYNYPREDDHWVLDGVASALLLMTPEERPENLWRPILDIPGQAHLWPESFLRSFHRAGLQQDPIPPRFASLRAAIIEYALGNDERLIDTCWPQTEEVWLALFGIDEFTRRCWEPRHRELADMSRPLFEQWMARGRVYIRHMAALAAWLEKEAADPVRLRGLVWLYRVLIGGDTKKLGSHASAQDPVASLLHVAWQKDESRIREDFEAFAAFRGLLRWLTDQQNPVALELLGRLGGLS